MIFEAIREIFKQQRLEGGRGGGGRLLGGVKIRCCFELSKLFYFTVNLHKLKLLVNML